MDATPNDPSGPDLRAARRMLRLGALGTMVGIVLSGPLAILVIEAVAPQPPWSGPAAFIEHFARVQIVPYLAGFVLVGSLLALLVGVHLVARPAARAHTTLALVLMAVFASFIALNYTLQTTWVPHLVVVGGPQAQMLIEALSMGNPTSFAWALEMWGYGVLGVATWIAAPALSALGSPWAARLFVLNGVVSVVGALWTMVAPGWEMTPAGLAAFAAWNVVLFAMALAAFRAGRPDDTRRSPA